MKTENQMSAQVEDEKPRYEVIVGNIGCAHETEDKTEAERVFEEYVEQSKSGVGRAAGEDVTLMSGTPGDDHIVKEYTSDKPIADTNEAELFGALIADAPDETEMFGTLIADALAKNPDSTWHVVSTYGTVYTGNDEQEARTLFADYKKQQLGDNGFVYEDSGVKLLRDHVVVEEGHIAGTFVCLEPTSWCLQAMSHPQNYFERRYPNVTLEHGAEGVIGSIIGLINAIYRGGNTELANKLAVSFDYNMRVANGSDVPQVDVMYWPGGRVAVGGQPSIRKVAGRCAILTAANDPLSFGFRWYNLLPREAMDGLSSTQAEVRAWKRFGPGFSDWYAPGMNGGINFHRFHDIFTHDVTRGNEHVCTWSTNS